MANKPVAAKIRKIDPKLAEFLDQLEPHPMTTGPVNLAPDTLRAAAELIWDQLRQILKLRLRILELEEEVRRLRAALKSGRL